MKEEQINILGSDDSDNEGLDENIEIDKNYAYKYTIENERKLIEKYEEMKKKGELKDDDGDSDDVSDDDEEELEKALHPNLFNVLEKVKKGEISKEGRMFASENEGESDSEYEEKSVRGSGKEKKVEDDKSDSSDESESEGGMAKTDMKGKKAAKEEENEEESSDDDGDDEELKGALHPEFKDALEKIRSFKNRDEILTSKESEMFDIEHDSKPKKDKVKEKKIYLKDVLAKQAKDEDEMRNAGKAKERGKDLIYNEEQKEARDKFLMKIHEEEEEDDEDILIEKKRDDNDGDEGAKEDEGNGDGEEDVDPEEKFLKEFFTKKLWIPRPDKGVIPDVDDSDLDDEDVEHTITEEYESKYNHRYEEGAGDQVKGYSRYSDGSVRNIKNPRKEARKRKAERDAQKEAEMREELKHMKNLKKKQIEEKLKKIREIAGISEDDRCLLDEEDLEKDFDPEEHDKKMKRTFNKKYYEKPDTSFGSDAEDGFDLEKPNFDEEDKLLGLPKNWDVCKSDNGFGAACEKVSNLKSQKKEMKDIYELSDIDAMKEEPMLGEGKRKRKRKVSLTEKLALDEAMEEYHKLDYEDTIGDLKTRFKYRPVPARKFGLKSEDILSLEDKELNEYVPLKKIGTYREEYVVPKRKRNSMKKKIMLDAQGADPIDNIKSGKKNRLNSDLNDRKALKHRSKDADLPTSHETNEMEQVKLKSEDSESKKESRRAKRRKRQAELKISQERLIAYGFVTMGSKSKKK